MCEHIELLIHKIGGKKYTSKELHSITEEFSKLQREFDKKSSEVANLDEFAQKVNQIIRDRVTSTPVTAADRLAHIQGLLKRVNEILKKEEEGVQKLDKKWA
ncbi:hypothetical protein X975_19639, partial [Stegodyphus mimosarum]